MNRAKSAAIGIDAATWIIHVTYDDDIVEATGRKEWTFTHRPRITVRREIQHMDIEDAVIAILYGTCVADYDDCEDYGIDITVIHPGFYRARSDAGWSADVMDLHMLERIAGISGM